MLRVKFTMKDSLTFDILREIVNSSKILRNRIPNIFKRLCSGFTLRPAAGQTKTRNAVT